MRVLVLHRELPFPADNGGRLRAAYLARYLAAKHSVSLICFAARETDTFPESALFHDVKIVPMPARPAAWRRLLSRFPSEVLELTSKEMSETIRSVIEGFDPDVMLVSEPALTSYLAPYRKRSTGRRLFVLDYLMVTTLSLKRLGDLASGFSRLLWRARWLKAAALHRDVARTFDLCLVNSQEDYDDLIESGDAWKRIEFLPNGLLLDEYPLGLAEPQAKTMIYPGSVTYPPNRDAVQYLIQEILPRIREKHPDARLIVTGHVPVDGSAPQAEGVEYTGRVDDIRRVIASAWVCVVPLRCGAGGTRFKLLESLALGTPLVSTRVGAEGLAYSDGVNILIADQPEHFAEQVNKLFSSVTLRQELSSAGRRLIEEQYDWNVLGDRVIRVFNELRSSSTTPTNRP